jgi:hypothetical protein
MAFFFLPVEVKEGTGGKGRKLFCFSVSQLPILTGIFYFCKKRLPDRLIGS